jgi:Flp pilus assembly protein TadG
MDAVMRRIGRFENEGGASLIEIALVLPVFFLLVFGIFQFAIVFCTFSNANYAVRKAARYASIHSTTALNPCTPATVQSMVAADLFVSASQIYVVTVTGCPGSIGSNAKVSVSWSQKVYLPAYTTPSFDIGASTIRPITR